MQQQSDVRQIPGIWYSRINIYSFLNTIRYYRMNYKASIPQKNKKKYNKKRNILYTHEFKPPNDLNGIDMGERFILLSPEFWAYGQTPY